MSDDEEEEAVEEGEGSEPDIADNLPLRQPISRHSKANRQAYHGSDGEPDAEAHLTPMERWRGSTRGSPLTV